MIIRLARREDVEALCRIVREATRRMDEQGIHQWDDVYPNCAMLSKDVERQELHVLELESRIVGFVVINGYESPEYADVTWQYPGPTLVVHRLAISPAYERRGLAKRLMSYAEETAAFKGYNCIRLDAFTGNSAAFRLYEKLGYRRAGIVQFRMGPFYCYEKEINATHTKTRP